MSDYDSFDSFESGSDSESDSETLQAPRVRELSEPKRHVGPAYSDQDELESSTASTTAPQSLWPKWVLLWVFSYACCIIEYSSKGLSLQ